MWKFHLIHHTDTHVDVTTALRHHPGESVFRAVFTILAIFVAGAPIAVVFIYQTFSALFSQFNHANFRIPRSLDKALSWVIVTPDMHKVHHHYQQPLTDTNYGNIFSLWDRIFRTFAQVRSTTDIVYGIDTHMDESEHNDVKNLMAIPFQPYRKRPEPPPLEDQEILKD
jgi:sterol desaturase/sphingolipid hydroxylase (fatty acid hydroxylase superfamily)